MLGEIVVAVLVTAAVVIGFVIYTLKNLLLVSSPNEVLILSGGTHPAEGRTLGYRSVRGGRVVRMPLLERVDRMDLSNIPVEIAVKGAYSKGGIPLNIHGVAQVKLPSDEPRLGNAVERFLGRSRDTIAQVARETLEGDVRGVLARLTPEQVNQDKIAFSAKLLEEAEHDMLRIGLVLDTLKIQNVTDDVNYLNSTGRIQGARVRMEASIVEAQMQAESAEQKADNWAKSEIAKLEADLAIAKQETDKRIRDAQSKREAMIQEARGSVLALIAQAKAEIERQKARAVQVERQLVADVIQPQDAARRQVEEAARGQAAQIIENGKAEAAALRALVEEYKKAGPNAREVLALQQLVPLLGDIAGANQALRVKQITVLPAEGGGDGSIARKAIAAAEQLRAATGVDLADVAKRFAAVPHPPPPPVRQG
ncbi:MAG TPA: SPFH domain-containing protein [Minicystis sp.]|nr:SPFH domain-containing protein [Minicystis sp.]